MKILGIDTANGLSVSLLCENEIFEKTTTGGKGVTSQNIIPLVDCVLKENNLSLHEVDGIACVVGPGSFTGIRIGVSVANAFGFSLSKPLLSINTFELMKEYANDGTLCLVDAGHNAFYGAIYKNGAFSDFGEYTQEDLQGKDHLVYQSFMSKTSCKVGAEKLAKGETVFELEPFYMKKSQAERKDDDKLS